MASLRLVLEGGFFYLDEIGRICVVKCLRIWVVLKPPVVGLVKGLLTFSL